MTTAATDGVVKTATFRVFKRDDRGIDGPPPTRWRDLGTSEFTGRYSATPNAEALGARWGEGEYMFFEPKTYSHIEFMTVVAETVYNEKHDDDGPA